MAAWQDPAAPVRGGAGFARGIGTYRLLAGICGGVLCMLLAGSVSARSLAALQKGPLPDRDPGALVAAYVEADADGLQTSSENWPLVRRFAVWEDGPGWDTVTIVTAAKVHKAQLRHGRATVRVRYDIFGTLYDDGDYNPVLKPPRSKSRTVTFRLIQRHGRWKIVAPQDGPRVGIAQLLDERYATYCREHDCAANRAIAALRAERARHPFAVTRSAQK